MNVDVRMPMGLMFTLIGAILAVFGAVGRKDIYEKSLGVNVNLWWGLVMLVFGLTMLLLAWRAVRSARHAGETLQRSGPTLPGTGG